VSDPLVEVRDLVKHYPVSRGLLGDDPPVRAVDGVSFSIHPGETLGLFGDSGCVKSTTARTLVHLEEPTDGAVYFDGERVGDQDEAERKRFRRRTGMIFQDPNAAFDPRMTVGESVAEPLRIHGLTDPERRRAIVEGLLERVGLTPADFDRYPHEFSGGQTQRLGLARALVIEPDLLVADEPVSGLDVSVQASVLDLLAELQDRYELATLFVSHDVSVVRQVCDRVAVMYLGEIVEIGPTKRVFDDPQHPYTEALLAAVPSVDPAECGVDGLLAGDVPDPADPPKGCRFHTRCPAVVPPDEYDLPQEEWQAVMRLRSRAGDVDLGALRDRLDGDGPVHDDRVRSALREEHDLPDRLSDERADREVAAAIDDLVDGDREAAAAHLVEAFPTVCANEAPALETTEAGHPAACHRCESGTEAESDD
jgi:peptide/nickel transport system ATP-binding protein